MPLSEFSRFAEPAVLILTSLAENDKHGYGLVQDIEAFADVRLGPGTLYGAVARLEERGLIEALPAQGRRRPYRMTTAGARALHGYLSHARTVTEVGLGRLGGAPV